jgi:hypothetical protein
MMDEYGEEIIIEGYCMRDRETVEMENPIPVWTRKGQPATRGECPICGGTVFRMGKTELHDESQRPDPVKIGDGGDKRTAPKLARDTIYLNYAENDEEFAQQLAADLEKSGIAVWMHEAGSDVNWSSGVHPALKQCSHMVLVLSDGSLVDEEVVAAWGFFRDSRKPILIAQLAQIDPPDRIRRSPRYDFSAEYKASLRQMVREMAR